MSAADLPAPKLGEGPWLMGVLNLTPDSFSDGGAFLDPQAAVAHGLAMLEAGADLIDVGGESTRPGAPAVTLPEELSRVMPVVERLCAQAPGRVSIDTMKPEVAREAVAAGAAMWNDVTALAFTPESLATAAELGCHVVLMHMQGDPRTMQNNPTYDDVAEEVAGFLAERAMIAERAGIAPGRIWVDPGIGFGKSVAHNLELIREISRLRARSERRLVFGASRKSFIGKLSKEEPAQARLGGSIAAALAAWEMGADMIRVHDVAETAQALRVWLAIGEGM